jgi:hypothetical protein
LSQRDRAERKVHDKHGHASDWNPPGKAPHRPGGHSDGVNTEQRKAHKAAVKRAKRARRRLDKQIIEEEL